MAYDDGIKIGPVAYVGVVSAILTVALVLMLQVLYYQVRNSAMEKEWAMQGPPQQLTDLTSEQQTALTRRGFVDRERDLVAVGISTAKELVLKDLSSGKTPAEANGPTAPGAGNAGTTQQADESAPADAAQAGNEGAEAKSDTDAPAGVKPEPKDSKQEEVKGDES